MKRQNVRIKTMKIWTIYTSSKKPNIFSVSDVTSSFTIKFRPSYSVLQNDIHLFSIYFSQAWKCATFQ